MFATITVTAQLPPPDTTRGAATNTQKEHGTPTSSVSGSTEAMLQIVGMTFFFN